MLQANLYSIPLILIVLVIMTGSFILIWDQKVFLEGFRKFRYFYTYLLLFSGFFLHEVIHLFSYHLVGRVPMSELKIGFQLKTITPYAHCRSAMPVSAYRAAALMPGILLGIVPGIIFLILGNSYYFLLSIIFTISAGGDLLLIWMLRRIPSTNQVQDHPQKAGCIVLPTKS